jgi:hypothetical protein
VLDHRRKLFVAQTGQRIGVLDFVVLTRQDQRNHFEVKPRLGPAHLRDGLFPVLAEKSRSSAQITASLSLLPAGLPDYASALSLRQVFQ